MGSRGVAVRPSTQYNHRVGRHKGRCNVITDWRLDQRIVRMRQVWLGMPGRRRPLQSCLENSVKQQSKASKPVAAIAGAALRVF
jgi:hypothetical protein